jgi:hypothetical protein
VIDRVGDAEVRVLSAGVSHLRSRSRMRARARPRKKKGGEVDVNKHIEFDRRSFRRDFCRG